MLALQALHWGLSFYCQLFTAFRVTVGYSDTFANPRGRHCNRRPLYIENDTFLFLLLSYVLEPWATDLTTYKSYKLTSEWVALPHWHGRMGRMGMATNWQWDGPAACCLVLLCRQQENRQHSAPLGGGWGTRWNLAVPRQPVLERRSSRVTELLHCRTELECFLG